MPKKLDPDDVKIISHLQRDASRSPELISNELGLSLQDYEQRIAQLKSNGILEQSVALIDNERVGLPLTVFVFVNTVDHSDASAERFVEAAQAIPEVVEFYRLGHDAEYILKMMVGDIAHYDRIHKILITKIGESEISAYFASDKLKFTTELPLEQALNQDLKA
jgi:Lrp/AsnC family transcriptional regulator